MHYLIFSYKWSPRDLKKIIVAILKSWFADNIKKINYSHNYLLTDNKIEKKEEKLVLIHTNNQDGLLDFLIKKFPQMEKIEIK